MRSLVFLITLSIIVFSNAFGQSVVRGKITDNNGEVPVGVSVYLKSNTTVGTTTDINGLFSLKVNETTPQTLVVSYIGYMTIEDTIICKKGSVLIKNYVLQPKSSTMKEVVVKAKAYVNNDVQLDKLKSRTTRTIDFISAETIKKTGDANVASAVARVTGVSTNSGGLITVRGIGDRYVKTTINGSRIPTLDPFTNNIKLDMFPASLIDNIIITKTASSDLPGDWAGAYLSVETKDYPDSLSFFAETSFGYNNQTTFKDIVTSDRSKTDWLGYDNGFRNYNHNDFVNFIPQPTTFQEFVALGLGNYFNSLGVTSNTPWNDTYFKMGLVQLGLLGPAQIDDPTAFQNAKDEYNTLAYKGHAFDILNADAVKSAKTLPNNWNTITRKAPLNNSQSFTIGNQISLFGNPIGFLVGLRYSGSIQSDENSIKNKIIPATKYDGNTPISDSYDYSMYQNTSKETNGWSGLMKLAYKLNPNNNVSFLFMPNIIGINNVRDGRYYSIDLDTKYDFIEKKQFYESRKQMIYQLKTDHYFPSLKLKIECNASYTKGKSDAPDLRIVRYNPYISQLNNVDFSNDGRYFRYLTENVFDSRISAEMPIDNKADFVRKIKIGGSYLNNYLLNKHYYYQLVSGIGADQIQAANPNADPFGPDRFDIVTVQDPSTGLTTQIRSVQEYYVREMLPSSSYFGHSNVIGGFAMIDYTISPSIRFSGGVRIEKAKMFTDCNLFDSLKLSANDPRRTFWDEGIIGLVKVNPGELNKISYLPSANLIYKINYSEATPVNLRFNFSQTVARPSIRELSDNAFFDYELNAYVKGNSQLKMVQINNYDVRLESYFKSGDNISVSVFYKGLQNHVELMNFGGIYMWVNNENYTWLGGIEMEGKKNIYKWLEFKANITLVNSQSKIQGNFDDGLGHYYHYGTDNLTRPMFNQAPYVLNSMLTYSSDKLGITTSLNYNIQGSRLVILGPSTTIPDVYELPRHLFDFKISKKISKHFTASLKVLDIFNSPIVRSYKFEKNTPYFTNIWNDITNKNKNEYVLIYDKYRFGTNFIFALSYKL